MIAKPVRFTVDPRKKPRQKPTLKPDGKLERYPSTCEGCGEKCTLNGGYVEMTDAVGGHWKYHYFGCGD